MVPGLETAAARVLAVVLAVVGLTGVGLAAGLSVLALPVVLLGVAVEGFLISAFFSSSYFFLAAAVVVTLAVAGLAEAAGLTPLADGALSVVAPGLVTDNFPAVVFPATPFVLTSLIGAYAANYALSASNSLFNS